MGTTFSINQMITKDQNGECLPNISYGWSYLNTFNESFLTDYHYKLCYTMVAMEDWSSYILPHFMLIPVLLIVLVTILAKDKEDYKWFVFHTALLNLFLGIIRELTNFFESALFYTMIEFAINQAVNSIFPLAFTRFSYLYFPDAYEKLFTRKTIFFWILGYDAFIFGLEYIDHEGYFYIPHLCITIFLLIFTIFCSCLIFRKIRNMRKLVGSNHQLTSYNNLNRAAFVCIFQASIISLHLLNSIFCLIYMQYMATDDYLFNFFFGLYMFLSSMQYSLYYFFVIIDSLMTLVVLKSYRVVFKRVCRKFIIGMNIKWNGKSVIHVHPMIQIASRISHVSVR